jgi:hypothetical protein
MLCVFPNVGIMALGHISSFSQALAAEVISSNALPPLVEALANEAEDHIRSATAWSLGQIGKHSPEQAKAVTEAGAMPLLVTYLSYKGSSEDLQTKCELALKVICNRLSHYPAIDSLLQVHNASKFRLLVKALCQFIRMTLLIQMLRCHLLFTNNIWSNKMELSFNPRRLLVGVG